MPKHPYSLASMPLQSASTLLNRNRAATHARSIGQAAGRRRDEQGRAYVFPRDADAAGGDDRHRPDLALSVGAGAAETRRHIPERYLDRADDGVALHGRHRLLAAHHGAAVGPLRPPPGIA